MSDREAALLYAHIQAVINGASVHGSAPKALVEFNERLYRAMNKCEACVGFGSYSTNAGMAYRCEACDGKGYTE